MRFLVWLGFAAVSVLYGQSSAVSIQTASPGVAAQRSRSEAANRDANPRIGVPTLGFVADPEGRGLFPMRGAAAAPVLGELMAKPAGVGRIFLPPRQHYALVEQSSPDTVAVWHLANPHLSAGKDLLDAIPGVAPHADIVAFSPTGKTAAFYSVAKSQIQVVTGLPGTPSVHSPVSAAWLGQLTSLLVTDDGNVLLGISSNGQISLSTGAGALRAMSWTYSPRAASFVSNSHSLLFSDTRQKQLVLIENVDAQSAPPAVIGSGLQPDHLGICSHGDAIVALDATNQKLWQIDAKTLAVTSLALVQQADTLVVLRDGHTFLLSTSPLYLTKITDDAAPRTTLNGDPAISSKQ